MTPPSVYCGTGVLNGDTVRGCGGLRFLICGTPSTTWTGNDGTSKNLFIVDDSGAATSAALVGPSVQHNFAAAFGPGGSVRYAYADFGGANPILKIASLNADLSTTNWTHTLSRIGGAQAFNPTFYGNFIVDVEGAVYVSYIGYKVGAGSQTWFLDKIDADGSLGWSVELASGGLRIFDIDDSQRPIAMRNGDMVRFDADGGGYTTLWSSAGAVFAARDGSGDLAHHSGSGDLYKVEDDNTAIWNSTIDSGPSRTARQVRVDSSGDFHVVHYGSSGDNTYRKFRGSDGVSLIYREAGQKPEAIGVGSGGEILIACSSIVTISGGGPTGSHFRFDGSSISWAFSVPVTNSAGYGQCDVYPRTFKGA